jgi:hypothetical protein
MYFFTFSILAGPRQPANPGTSSATDQQIASFTGTEVDASEVEMLETTWAMFLSDLDALRTAAGEDANRQQLATGLHESGTVFGQALTAYKDAAGKLFQHLQART